MPGLPEAVARATMSVRCAVAAVMPAVPMHAAVTPVKEPVPESHMPSRVAEIFTISAWRAGLLAQQPQPVGDDQQARAHIGEDGHPHRTRAAKCQSKEYRLDGQPDGDVLHEDIVGRT